MAYVVVAHIVTGYTVMVHEAKPNVVMALYSAGICIYALHGNCPIGMAYTVIAHRLTVVRRLWPIWARLIMIVGYSRRRDYHICGLHRYGLCSYGLCMHGPCSYGLL